MNYIVDDIGEVVEAMRPVDLTYGQAMLDYIETQGWTANLASAPYYLFGHRLSIANRLTEMETDSERKYKKYPLVALAMDVPEKPIGGMIEFVLNIGFFAFTDREYTVEERYTNVFKPVLYPMFERFKTEFRNAGLFMWGGDQDFPPHQKFDRPLWGTPGNNGNTANGFKDPLDAIELVGVTFKTMKNC